MTLDRVRAEIEQLHRDFEAWFRDEPQADFAAIAEAIPPELTFVAPSGETVAPAEILESLEAARGSRDLRIRIENVEVTVDHDDLVIARYEEWHDHPTHTTTRQSTVVFVRDGERRNGLRWRLVHETWKVPPPST